MKGLNGLPLYELEEFINMESFYKLQIDIWKGIAVAKFKVKHGYLTPYLIYDPDKLSSKLTVKPLMAAYQEYKDLPNTDPIKITGEEISKTHGHNALTTFLKYAYGAHDACAHYLFWDHYAGWRSNTDHRKFTNIVEDFPTLISWIDTLITDRVFSNIGRAYLIAIESNGHSFEHCDPALDPDGCPDYYPEFIHIRPNLNRPFYVYDIDEKKKYYLNSRVGWWNDKDMHGGEAVAEPSYAIRIDGIFTDEFRNKIKKNV